MKIGLADLAYGPKVEDCEYVADGVCCDCLGFEYKFGMFLPCGKRTNHWYLVGCACVRPSWVQKAPHEKGADKEMNLEPKSSEQ